MVLEMEAKAAELHAKLNNYLWQSAFSTEVGTSNAVTSTSAAVPMAAASNVPANEDTIVTNNTQNYVEATTIRSEQEVNRVLDNIANHFNLSRNEVTNIIKSMTRKTFEDLLNLETAEYNKLTKGLELILKDCVVDNKIDANILQQAIRDYSVATQTGWSLEGFYNQQKNVKKSTIQERLVATGCLSAPLDPNDPNYEAKMEVAIENFFKKTLLSKINENTPQAERERIYKAQLQTFGRLLVNTPAGRDKELLGAAIDKLYRSNIVSAAKAGIQSMDSEDARANFAGYIDYEEAVMTESEYETGVLMTREDARELANIIFGNINYEEVQTRMEEAREAAETFFAEYAENIAEIEEKIRNGQKLTKEEEYIIRQRDVLHTDRYSGMITGIAGSNNSTVLPNIEGILGELNWDTFEIGKNAGNDFYKDVLTGVVESVNKLPESVSKKELVATLKGTFRENYDEISNYINTGKEPNLYEPQLLSPNFSNNNQAVIVESAKETYITALAPKTESCDNTRVEVLKQSLKLIEDGKVEKISKVEKEKDFTEAVKKGSSREILAKAKDLKISNFELSFTLLREKVTDLGVQIFDRLGRPAQVLAFNKINNNEGAIAAAKVMDAEQLEKVDCVSFYLDEQVDKIKEEKEEKMA